MARGHQEQIAPLVQRTLIDSGFQASDITRVGATVGPGSFTGLRVGLAFVRAFAVARNIDCVGIQTLEALAAEVPDAGLALAAIRSRGESYYVQLFRDGAPTMAPDVLRQDEIASRILEIGGAEPVTIIGPEAEALLPLAPSSVGWVRSYVSGYTLHRLIRSAPLGPPPRPLYMRAPDARTLAERSADV